MPFQSLVLSARRSALLLLPLLLLSGCESLRQPQKLAEAPVVAPVATHTFTFDPVRDDVVGEVQITRAHEEDTLPDIARRFNIGYEEIVRANPSVDPWLPRAGTRIVLPTRFVLPKAPRKGIVINLAALRLYYFPPRKEGEPQTVITHPIGIGLVGWATPEGATKVTSKAVDPWWFPPASVRKEHRENGDPLPAKVPPGPDNPLGRHSMKLGWKSYLIHGTNKPYGVGMRASHGCIRLYPEDIAALFDDIPVGTSVVVVNQPVVYGWQNDKLYMQTFPVLEDDKRVHTGSEHDLLAAAIDSGRDAVEARGKPAVDRKLIEDMALHPRGITLPISGRAQPLDKYLTGVRHVENRLPEQANWDGKE